MSRKSTPPTVPRKIVVVLWKDILTRGDWVGDREEVIEQVRPMQCVTVGWLLVDCDEYLLLADTVSKDKDYSGVTVIPKGVVVRVEELKKSTPTSFMDPE